MSQQKQIKRALDRTLLDFTVGHLSTITRQQVLQHLYKKISSSFILSNLIKIIHRPAAPEEKEKISAANLLTPEQQAEKIVAFVRNDCSRSLGGTTINDKLNSFGDNFMVCINYLKPVPQFLSLISGSLVIIGIILILLLAHQSKSPNQPVMDTVFSETHQLTVVPKFLHLRPIGTNLVPDIFSNRLGRIESDTLANRIEQQLREKKQDMDFLNIAARYYLLKGDYNTAEFFYKKLLTGGDNKSFILNDLAVIHFEYGDKDYAHALLVEAQHLTPDAIEILYNLALVSYSLGNTEQADKWQDMFLVKNNSCEWENEFNEKITLLRKR